MPKKNLKQQLIAGMMVLAMSVGLLPGNAFAAETAYVPEDTIEASAVADGQFYLASRQASVDENGGSYLLRIARGGDVLPATQVRLEMLDVTASYGTDYTVELLDAGLLASGVQNGGESQSLLDRVTEAGDALVEQPESETLSALSEEELDRAAEQETQDLTDYLGEALSRYADAHPAEYVTEATVRDDPEPAALTSAPADPAGAETGEQSSLSRAFEEQTGLRDDWQPMSSDGSGLLDFDRLLSTYTMDTVSELVQGLNSAFLPISFAEGQREAWVSLRPIDNREGQGDRLVILCLFADAENAAVAASYAECTVSIADDEAWDYPTVSFTGVSYEAEGGYVTVTVRRDGILTPVSSVHFTTSDGSALNGRDYSKVDADVAFPFGVAERTIRIPVRSDYLSEAASFSFTLSDPQSCRLGERTEASGLIEAGSESFVLLSSAETPEDGTASLAADAPGLRYGDNINLSYYGWNAWSSNPNANDKSRVGMDGNEFVIHSDSSAWAANTATCYAVWRTGSSKAYSGLEIKWKKTGGGKSRTWVQFSEYSNDHTIEYSKTADTWDETIRVFPAKGEYDHSGVDVVRIFNDHKGGNWRRASDLRISYIRPILRPFEITASIANQQELLYVDANGSLVSYREHDKAGDAGNIILSGATENGKGSVVKYLNDTVEVRCENPFTYIKQILVQGHPVTSVYPEGTTTASFRMDSYMMSNVYVRGLEETPNPAGGTRYKLPIQVVLGQNRTAVTLNNTDKRGEVYSAYPLRTAEDGSKYAVLGDYVCFGERLHEDYKNSYTASHIGVDRVRETGSSLKGQNERGEMAFDRDGGWTFTFSNMDYASLEAYPVFDDIQNHVVVRVADEELAKFDTGSGVFQAKRLVGGEGYSEFEVVSQDAFRALEYYALSAVPKDKDSVAVWQSANSTAAYSQNQFWYRASSEAGANILTLTCRKADETPYTVTGTTYYSDYNLKTRVEGAAWMPAPGVTLAITPIHYAISGRDGKFATNPMKGVAGCCVILKTESLGSVDYQDVPLAKGPAVSLAGVQAYEVSLGARVMPLRNPAVPYISTAALVNAAGVDTALAVDFPDDLSAGNNKMTFSATVYNDGAAYQDSDGKARVEHIRGVEFAAYDHVTNEKRGVLPGTVVCTENESGSKTYSLTLGLSLAHQNIYRPGDKIYVQLLTDRVKGNGVSLDENGNKLVDEEGRLWTYDAAGNPSPVLDENGKQRTSTAFQETEYPPIYTGFNITSSVSYDPVVMDYSVLNTNLDSIFTKLPVFGSLNSTFIINDFALSTQELPGGGVSLCVGKVVYRITEQKDNSIRPNDTGKAFESFSETVKGMKEFGEQVKNGSEAGTGLPKSYCITPFFGLYLDFGFRELGYGPGGASADLEFIGGGLYFGASGSLRVVLYFPLFTLPTYFGIETTLGSYVNLGFAIPDNAPKLSSMNKRDSMNSLAVGSVRILVRSYTAAYVGAGLAGTLGVRGGLTLYLNYIYYPSVKKIYGDGISPHGLNVSLSLKIWADAYLFSIPIPVMNLVNEDFGYLKDINNVGQPSGDAKLASAEDAGPQLRQTVEPGAWQPQRDSASLQASYALREVELLLPNNYAYADPQLLDISRGNLLVFLTTDKSKPRGDEATLVYSVLLDDASDWSQPVRIGFGETLRTGDFQPNLSEVLDADGNAKVMISWISRRDEAWCSDPEHTTAEEQLAYLSQMEVYTALLDERTMTIDPGSYERLTEDSLYNCAPRGVGFYAYGGDMEGGARAVFYQASEPALQNIAADDPRYVDLQNPDSRQLVANVSPSQNGSFLKYRRYDPDTEAWMEDRFVPTPAGGTNHPTVEDFTAQSCLVSGKDWGVFAYTVDADNDLSTPYDRDLYLQFYDLAADRINTPICVTKTENLAESRPQFVDDGQEHYLFWYETADRDQADYADWPAGGNLRVLNVTDLMENGLTAEGNISDTVSIADLKARYRAEFGSEPDLSGLEPLEENYPYDLEISAVRLPYAAEFEEGPSLSSYIPYVDEKGNIYIAWLQTVRSTAASDTEGEAPVTNRVYVAAMIEETEAGKAGRPSWSMPVRLTDDALFYDEIAMTVSGYSGKLFIVGNQYALDLENEGVLNSADLVCLTYQPCPSVAAEELQFHQQMPIAGETVSATMTLRNRGLIEAVGARYRIHDVIDGKTGSFELEATVHAGENSGRLAPGEAVEVTFDYPVPEQLPQSGSIAFAVEVEEFGFPASSALETVFAGEDGLQIRWHAVLADCEVIEYPDGFYLFCNVTNDGNLPLPANTLTLRAGSNEVTQEGGQQEIWITTPIQRAIAPRETAYFAEKLGNVSDLFENGYRRGTVWLESADGPLQTEYDTADIVLWLDTPYNLVVNGDQSLTEKGITLKAGESLPLSGSYDGTSFFTDGAMLFSADDPELIRVSDGALQALSPGETRLRVRVAQYGGEIMIPVTVTEKAPTPIYPSGGGGSMPATNPIPATGGDSDTAAADPIAITVTADASGATAHGAVTVSTQSAGAGETVTVTAQPDEGYVTAGVTVTDKNGSAVPVTKNADGTYSFTMPSTAVSIAAAFAPAGEPEDKDLARFGDVAKTAWYHDAVQWAVDKGIMNGVASDAFDPSGVTTRAMVVTMLWRMAGEQASAGAASFTDVEPGSWYAQAVNWAVAFDVVKGMTADSFAPDSPVTREQLAVILYRYAQTQGKSFTGEPAFPTDFSDAAEVSGYAYEAMCWMTVHGIITGMGDGALAPKDNATRAQIATMFMRFAAEMEK